MPIDLSKDSHDEMSDEQDPNLGYNNKSHYFHYFSLNFSPLKL
jgi:hypothetical protein